MWLSLPTGPNSRSEPCNGTAWLAEVAPKKCVVRSGWLLTLASRKVGEGCQPVAESTDISRYNRAAGHRVSRRAARMLGLRLGDAEHHLMLPM